MKEVIVLAEKRTIISIIFLFLHIEVLQTKKTEVSRRIQIKKISKQYRAVFFR